VWGPSWGPAILFWSYLILVVLVAIGLGRSKKTPLGVGEWFLLGLGLTQIPSWAALIVVGWFFAIAHRAKHPDLAPLRFDLRQLALVGYTFVAVGTLYAAVHAGLLVNPDMDIVSGDGSGHLLSWYVDRTGGELPRPGVISLPLWIWKLMMLAWALWLAWRVVHWARWSWQSFSTGGLWKRLSKTPVAAHASGFGPPITSRDDTPKIVKTQPKVPFGAPPAATTPVEVRPPEPTPPAAPAPTDPDAPKTDEPKNDDEAPKKDPPNGET
jgi:hypothetical protein